jgi:putative methionine-R-sulfoxide reductase with GAF domain
VNTPAYASLNGSSQTVADELCEILNISESGTCIQAPEPMKLNRLLPLVLDLSSTGDRIHTTGHVVWSEISGRTGIRFPELPESSLIQLRRWLSANNAAAGGNSLNDVTSVLENESGALLPQTVRTRPASAAGYSSLIAEWAAIEKEVDLCGPNLDEALHLIAERALVLTWATGAAIALSDDINASELICMARAGSDSPELGVSLDANAGFSGECVRSRSTLICDDTDSDRRVDRESCRALGVRSVIACPIISRQGATLGILEVFSPETAAFWGNDARIMERLARIIATAADQTKRRKTKVLPLGESEENKLPVNPDTSLEGDLLRAGRSPRSRRAIFLACGTTVAVAGIWLSAPWISDAMTKFATPSTSQAAEVTPTSAEYVGIGIADLKTMALQNDSAAQFSLAMKYASGSGTVRDYHEALGWFLKAADNGNTRAPAKIASCFWAGKGAPQDYGRAYLWGLIAQSAGDETGHIIVINSSPHLSDHQRSAEQQEADSWLRSHNMGPLSSRLQR